MRSHYLLFLTLGLTVSGCGTAMNLRDVHIATSDIFEPGHHPAPKAIYGGVRTDAVAGQGWMQESRDDPPKILLAGYVWLVDLPLSAVGDTLTLPITVPHSIKEMSGEPRGDAIRVSQKGDSGDARHH